MIDKRDDLKAKARELEREDQPRAALELYLRLVVEAEADQGGAVWSRVGELQLKLGDSAAAQESLSRSIDLFAEASQLNNAIAVGRRLLDVRPDDADTRLRLAEMALRKGYRSFARDAIATYASQSANGGNGRDAVGAISTFLERYGDETELWREWAEELVAAGRREDAVEGLRELADFARGAAQQKAARRIEEEITAIDPSAAPSTPDSRELSGALPQLETPEKSDLIETGAVQEADEVRVAPLAGLEPTHAGADWDEDPALPSSTDDAEEDSEPLPLLDTSGERWDEPDAESKGEALESEEQDDYDPEPLPLLGVEPVATPRAAVLGTRDGNADEDSDFPEEGSVETSPNVFESAPELTSTSAEPDEPEPQVAALNVQALADKVWSLTERQVDPADASTHYDVGLAYKEMDLHEESFAQLAAALEGGHDPFSILEVLGEVLVGRGDAAFAEELLRPAAAATDGRSPELIGIYYWLGRSAEEQGDVRSAEEFLSRVVEIDPNFRDAADRVSQGR